MKKWIMPVAVMVFALFLTGAFAGLASAGGEAQRITQSQLKAQLGQPDVIVLDARRDSDWNASGRKIAGALRESPGEFRRWADKYPKDKTIVLYCA